MTVTTQPFDSGREAQGADAPAPGPPYQEPAGPVAEAERITGIDALRGVAVIGILMVNIQFMAIPMQQAMDLKWREMPFLDGMARLIVHLFFELKFITLFSLLFGAGLAIQMERLQRTGRPFVRIYIRRLLVLLVIGLIHGILLWYGDILAVYAILGFAALLFRNCRPRTLIIWSAALFLVPVAGLFIGAAVDPVADWTTPDWSSFAASTATSKIQPATDAATSQVVVQSEPDPVDRFIAFMADETRIYQSGTFGECVALRASYFLIFNMSIMPIIYIWRCLSLFLLGMAAVRLRVFSADPVRGRVGIAAMALIAGLAMEIHADYTLSHHGMQAMNAARSFSISYVGSFILAMGYAIIVLGLSGRPNLQPLFRPLAAVGRMALSNYLTHSVIGGLIFYSHGLGLFGTIGNAGLFGIACAILASQLVISPIWLRHFQFGPVEWLWRTATYGKAQPMRRVGG